MSENYWGIVNTQWRILALSGKSLKVQSYSLIRVLFIIVLTSTNFFNFHVASVTIRSLFHMNKLIFYVLSLIVRLVGAHLRADTTPWWKIHSHISQFLGHTRPTVYVGLIILIFTMIPDETDNWFLNQYFHFRSSSVLIGR